MSFPTINIEYNRLRYKSKSGLSSVYLRIYFNGKTDYLKIDKVPKIHKKDWIGDARNGLWVRGNPMINDKLNEILTAARKYVSAQVMSNAPVTIKTIKEHFMNPEKLASFNSFAKDFVRNINKKRQENEKRAYRTIQAYNSFLVKLDEFNPKISFDSISPELLEDFSDFLASKHNLQKTTRAKHFDKFHVIYDAAATRKLVEFIPTLFKGYRARNKPVHIKLDINEIKRFKTEQLSDPVDDYYKTIFFFQLLTGLYMSDLRELRKNNYHETEIVENGRKVKVCYLEGERTKNNERFVIRLFPDALAILHEHAHLDHPDPNQVLFPDLISEQKYNARLKKIAKCLGIKKNISNKTARHSFGSWMVGLGNTREKLAATLGHTKDSTALIYSKLSPEQALKSWIEPEI